MNIPLNIPAKPIEICQQLRGSGYEAWLVGGAIRDSLMGRDPHDWDVATNARPEQVSALFERVIDTGLQHGTVTVVLGDERFEVTTYRADRAYSDGRHPDDIRFVNTIDEDLARRDFTMNAIAYDPISGETRDPFFGQADIERRVIRAVGDAEARFREDGLRMLRAARFVSTLGFNLSSYTEISINDQVPLNVAPERIHDEICKALVGEFPDRFLQVLANTGLLNRILPEMVPMIACLQNSYHEFDVWEHILCVVAATPPDLHLRLAAMFHDVAKPQTKGVHPKTGEATFYEHEEVGAVVADSIMDRLRFSNDDRQAVTHLIRHHLIQYTPHWINSTIRRWVRNVGAENVGSLLALGRADIAGKGNARRELNPSTLDELERRIDELSIEAPIVTNATQLAITGQDVMRELEISPGPAVGAKLRELLELVTDDPDLNTRERLLELLSSES
ncbi:MAG: CCA tRNA nucleotidyltransferase [Bryobacteraceae bacterium]